MTGEPDLDQLIAAYLDGAMSEDEALAFEQAVSEDPRLAAELERFGSNDDLLRAAHAEPDVSEEFLARMGLAAPAPATDAGHAPVTPANDNPPLWRRWQWPVSGAIAAGLALALTLNSQTGGEAGAFSRAMEQTPSGQVAALEQGATLTPLLTFRAGDGRYCREFAYAGAATERGGIACRDARGWSVEAWGDGAGDLPDPGQIALASGADTRSLDDAYRALRASDPIQAAREASLIRRGWRAE